MDNGGSSPGVKADGAWI